MTHKTLILHNILSSSFFLILLMFAALLQIILPASAHAAPSVFNAIIQEDVLIERAYESYDVSFNISKVSKNSTSLESSILKGKTLKGVIGLNTVNGNVIIEIEEFINGEVSLEAIGYAQGKGQENGVSACKEWRTRMFDDTKLCYAAEVKQGTSFKLVVTIEEPVEAIEEPPVSDIPNDEKAQ